MNDSCILHQVSGVETAASSQQLSAPQGHRMVCTMRELQAQLGGKLTGDPEAIITGVNAIDAAGPGELTFAESEQCLRQVRESRASAVIVPTGFPAFAGRTLLRVDHPRLAFAQAMELFQPHKASDPGLDPRAAIARDAQLGEDVTVREFAVIRSGARIGHRTLIESSAHIGAGVIIGEQCIIGPNVVIRRGCRLGNRVILHGGVVIGADGFGYVWDGSRHVKIPQLGNVIIEDDVELGANVCVDRATFSSTIIKRGTKVDNLVQIAHNDVIGEHVIMAAQVGLAGSVTVGNRVMIGGQVGVADHVTIGDEARIGAKSGVTKDVPDGQTVWWFPARPIGQAKRELAALALLPELIRTLRRPKHAGLLNRLMAVRRLPFAGPSFFRFRRHDHHAATGFQKNGDRAGASQPDA